MNEMNSFRCARTASPSDAHIFAVVQCNNGTYPPVPALVTAHYRVHADAAAVLDMLRDIPAHLCEACVGQVSEIMDGDAPFKAGGCFAQAWGVAEILRAWSEINDRELKRQATPPAARKAPGVQG